MNKILSLIFFFCCHADIFNKDVKAVLIIRLMEEMELEIEFKMELSILTAA